MSSKSRILIYSHDTFGLGHLRRCRAIAHHLVDTYKGITVLILTGSPIVGSFEFKARVDFIRLPGVIKLRNGEYKSLGLHVDLADTLAIREAIILQTAKTFSPDVFLVDKEPLGLKGEIASTLDYLQNTACTNILGLRDVLDDPVILASEWQRKRAVAAVETFYDDIWVFGSAGFYQPLQGIPLSPQALSRVLYTGFLKRYAPKKPASFVSPEQPFIVVTPGGGKDGVALIELVVDTYARGAHLPCRAVIVLGPFMANEDRQRFKQKAQAIDQIEILDFTTVLEHLMLLSKGVVAMGGYNTFCEILSFNKPALLAPRTTPRLEQKIRCDRAEELGLLQSLDPDQMNVEDFTAALHRLDGQVRPSLAIGQMPDLLSGMDNIASRLLKWLPHLNNQKRRGRRHSDSATKQPQA